MLNYVLDVKGLRQFEALAQERLEQAVATTAEQMGSEARARVPVRTGRLRDSIEEEKVGPHAWEVHDGEPYGVHVNYGTRYQSANGFFSQAFQNAEAALEHRVVEALIDAVKEAGL